MLFVVVFLFLGNIVYGVNSFDQHFKKEEYIKNKNKILQLQNNIYNILTRQLIKNLEISNDVWIEEEKLLPLNGSTDENFGISDCIDENLTIVGTPFDSENGTLSGSAYIFTYSDINWSQQVKLLPLDGSTGDRFGWSVSIDGDYAIVGSFGKADFGYYSGSAYIFARSGSNWTQQAKLLASDGATGDFFGWSVSIDGDYAIIGAYGDDDYGFSSGSAYIFIRSGSNWTQQAKLLASDGAAGDRFGWSVSINGDYALVGAHNSDGYQGSAYIFKRTNSTWIEQQNLTTNSNNGFGYSVSINGDYVIVGAPVDGDNGHYSGSAYVFTRMGSNWTQQAKLLASDGAAEDNFGCSVSIHENNVVVGAEGDDDNGEKSGSAYVFKRTGSNWLQQSKLISMDGAAGDYFGACVSINGNHTISGAKGDDDNGNESGSAYVFIMESSINQIPIVEIIYPCEGDTVSGILIINGTSDDPDGIVEFVEVKIDDEDWYNASGTTSWSYNWDTTLFSDEQHSIYARSYDGEDYSNMSMVNVTVNNYENEIPIVEIIYPDEGDTVAGTIIINGTAEDFDGIVVNVQVKIDGDEWENTSGTNIWSQEWNTTTVANGWYMIYARSFDGENYSNIDSINVSVYNSGNQPPNSPTIEGPITGKAGGKYEYIFNTIDPNNDDVFYYIDWGDGNFENWSGPYVTGQEVKINYNWTKKGTYLISAKAKDTQGVESNWTTLKVTMPKFQFLNCWSFSYLINKCSLLIQILFKILRWV